MARSNRNFNCGSSHTCELGVAPNWCFEPSGSLTGDSCCELLIVHITSRDIYVGQRKTVSYLKSILLESLKQLRPQSPVAEHDSSVLSSFNRIAPIQLAGIGSFAPRVQALNSVEPPSASNPNASDAILDAWNEWKAPQLSRSWKPPTKR